MSPTYVNCADPVAVVVIGVGRTLAPDRLAVKRSVTVMPTSSLQLPSASNATTVKPPNSGARMTASGRLVYDVYDANAPGGSMKPRQPAEESQPNRMSEIC